jgi:predicted DNA-binding transcriptional regulator YafY
VRALPEPMRADAELAAGALVVDRSGWDRGAVERPAPPLLDAIQDAVVRARQLHLGYVDRTGTATTRPVDPLGLATKGGAWYLVAGTEAGLRTFRVDRVVSCEETGGEAVRPPGFDLDATWRTVVDAVEERRTPVRALVLADPDAVRMVRGLLGARVRIGPTDEASGRVLLEIRGHSVRALAGELAGFGALLEVREPEEVRAELRRVADELVALYAS